MPTRSCSAIPFLKSRPLSSTRVIEPKSRPRRESHPRREHHGNQELRGVNKDVKRLSRLEWVAGAK